jgi:protein tyrosine/serine phosphatase
VQAKEAKRAARRAMAQWRQKLAGHTPRWLHRRLKNPLNYAGMLIWDVGFARVIYLNKHRVTRSVLRSAQPMPRHFEKLARRGIKTVINLRGETESGSYRLEKEACERLGMKLVNFKMGSRSAPHISEIKRFAELFNSVEYPILMHCKSGADRAGLASALYLHLKEGVPISEAKKQLTLRFGHIRQADTGVLDEFFERYLEDTRETPMPFMTWVETRYNRDELQKSFKAKGWANRVVNSVLKRE